MTAPPPAPALSWHLLARTVGSVLLLLVVLGLTGAYVLSRLMASVVWGISPHDPVTFAVVTLALGLVALCANVIPALRATLIQPMAAMREE